MEEIKVLCSRCGTEITEEDYETVNGEIACISCVEHHAVICDRCCEMTWLSESVQDENITLCQDCFDAHYHTCESCGRIIHADTVNWDDELPYCDSCYDNLDDEIEDYSYKPQPVFYGEGKRFFGVELEIDGGGKDNGNASILKEIANVHHDHIYIKSDGSLDDGLEIVAHPMSLDYHKNFCWEDIMLKAVRLGYRSHQTSTCGLHIHVNRTSLGELHEQQEEVISRILFFVEHHWNELLKFSRRSEVAINRWAARYGYESSPKAIFDKAKKGSYGRYAAVNLCNYHTIEFRLFRGTLKYNTLIAALELVNAICDLAASTSDEELQKLSWSDFVANLNETELIHYLKERNLYVNDKVEETEDL